jgi:hypothetical protein
MGGPAVELRMQILQNAADQQILKPLRTHGWHAEIARENQDGEYIVVTATKQGATHKVALLYTSATDNRHYKALGAEVDHIFTNGELYHIESYAYGIATPVAPIKEFFPVLLGWNKALAPTLEVSAPKPTPRTIRRITAECPLEAIWARLDQFGSIQLARKLVARRATEESKEISDDLVSSKAAGVAFAIRNASDYFRAMPSESLNRRVLSLYYGTLALAFAEMLASPSGAGDLDEVEGMTKLGHGLNTVQSVPGDFGSLSVVVRDVGFFPQWASFLGHDISHYPKKRPTSQSDLDKFPANTSETVSALLSSLPELGDLFLEVFDIAPSWIVPIYDNEANSGLGRAGITAARESAYIRLYDASGRMQEQRIQAAGWPLSELIQAEKGAEGQAFRARVDHPGYQYWHEALPVHRSPFKDSATLILPVFGHISEYRTIALVILYALSIMVRYMPGTWRRVEDGDLDQHLALVRTALGVFERQLPEEFLESIIGERIYARQPGSLF